MLALEEAVLVLDAQRRIHCHRVERNPSGVHCLLAERGSTVGGGEARGRLAAFAPHLPVSRAVALLGTDPRGRDAMLVSGAHWDCSVAVSLAHGGGGARATLHCHSALVTSVAVSSCGRWLMSGGLDSTALLWTLPDAPPSGGQSAQHAFAALAAGLHDAARHPTHVLRGHSAPVLCVAVSSALRLAASGSRDGTIALYTLRDGKRVRALRDPAKAEVEQVLLADAGFVVAVSAASSALHLYTINGLLAWSWLSDSAGISAVSLSPCQAALICGFDDGAILAWRLHDRQPLGHYVHAPAPVVCLSPTSEALFVGTSRADLLCYPAPPGGGWSLSLAAVGDELAEELDGRVQEVALV